ncbi:MAG: hypothetical protein K2I06_14070 [Ruminococcus sp.]|nr:hypothetical protein [Ruminococcus sp.]
MIDEIYNIRQGNLLTVPMSEEWETLCIKFEEMLTEEQLKMFHKLCDLQSSTSADEARTAYKASFKDGLALMREVQY